MIRLDNQAGSKDLEGPLRAVGLPVEMTRLPAGDIEFVGRGCGGLPVFVGAEYKKIPDTLTCERDGRFAEQLRAMRGRYDVSWLLIEGEWRVSLDSKTQLEVRERRGWENRGSFTYQEIASWALTMAQRGGALIWRSRDEAESVAWIRSLYLWWTSSEFEDHRSHLQWYTPPWCPESPFEKEPSVARKVAAALLAQGPTVDINAERAKAAAKHFGSVRAMLMASEKEWREVEGIGPKIAKRIAEGLR